jgi:hypothetical protein
MSKAINASCQYQYSYLSMLSREASLQTDNNYRVPFGGDPKSEINPKGFIVDKEYRYRYDYSIDDFDLSSLITSSKRYDDENVLHKSNKTKLIIIFYCNLYPQQSSDLLWTSQNKDRRLELSFVLFA